MVLLLHSERCYEAEICAILFPLRWAFTSYVICKVSERSPLWGNIFLRRIVSHFTNYATMPIPVFCTPHTPRQDAAAPRGRQSSWPPPRARPRPPHCSPWQRRCLRRWLSDWFERCWRLAWQWELHSSAANTTTTTGSEGSG